MKNQLLKVPHSNSTFIGNAFPALEEGSILAQIGNTPLLELKYLTEGLPLGTKVFAKAEHLNPSGSVKDRAARAIILDGIQTGALTKDKIILDATSGNTGIAYAMIGAALGYKVALCLPKNASEERKNILKAYNARIIETDPLQSSDGAQMHAKALANAEPEKYFYGNQYNNPANWKAHYNATAMEIWEQTGHAITHFIAGMGTSGTFMGTSRRLKELNPLIQTIAMQPDSPMHGLEGMKHMATTMKPGIYDQSIIRDTVEVATEDACATALLLARKEGVFVGISSGANVHAALQVARTLPPGSIIVTILCDNGNRYLSEELWSTYSI